MNWWILLHGTVDVSAELGKGSEFTVSLPAEDKVYRNDKGAEFILNDCALQAKELAERKNARRMMLRIKA